ncbi:CAP domain-containing protein [Streptomyces sp. NPDC056367]|uniref:CAP domain-containing protein n=1 Tax=Streptomyces sp. NPDC056367 TaxID=3345797 RepID=UPI0035D7363E
MGRHALPSAPRPAGARRTALRTGLLGAAVAVVLGTAAVTTGMVPVGGSFPYVGVSASSDADRTQAVAKASPSPDRATQPLGGLAQLPGRAQTERPSPTTSPSTSASPSASASASPSPSPSASASPAPSASASATPSAAPSAKPAAKPSAKPAPVTKAPEKTAAPVPAEPADGHSAEEAAVLALVNQERAMAGCGPVRANPPLATIAQAFSKDMATRGFFDHTDPDGLGPWDRAAKAGVGGLGGENIARGQGDAQSVMTAWMNSPGHKANILNCEFRTLGVGAYFADGGPWWTQDFGF